MQKHQVIIHKKPICSVLEQLANRLMLPNDANTLLDSHKHIMVLQNLHTVTLVEPLLQLGGIMREVLLRDKLLASRGEGSSRLDWLENSKGSCSSNSNSNSNSSNRLQVNLVIMANNPLLNLVLLVLVVLDGTVRLQRIPRTHCRALLVRKPMVRLLLVQAMDNLVAALVD